MNQLIIRERGSIAAAQSYIAAMATAVAAVPAGFDGKDILKINQNTKQWEFGEAGNVVTPDSLWAVNPLSLRHGWIAFADGKVAVDVDDYPAELLDDVTVPLAAYDSLPELKPVIVPPKVRGGKSTEEVPTWMFQLALDFACIEGGNTGVEVTYKPTSTSGLRMVRKLVEEMRRRLADENPHCVPLIELLTGNFTTRKEYGSRDITTPEFEIIEWVTMEEALGLDTGNAPVADPAPEPQPEPEETQTDAVYDDAADQADPAPAQQPARARGSGRATRRPEAAPVEQPRTASRGADEAAQPKPVAARRGARGAATTAQQPAAAAPQEDLSSDGRNSRPVRTGRGVRPR